MTTTPGILVSGDSMNNLNGLEPKLMCFLAPHAGFDPKNERLPKILGEPELPQSATAAELISKHGFDPASLKGIIWSHCHVDHYGNLDDYPTHVPVYVGEGSLSWLNGGDEAEGGLASFPSHFLTGGWKYTEIGASNKQFKKTSIGPFEEAWDFFGDGSAYIIKAEGHCPGHLCLLVRVNDNGDWALLAGDAAHSQSLYWPAPPAPYSVEKDLRSVPGKFKFSPDATTYSCMQDFPEKAFRTLSSLTRLEMEKNVIVLPAHEIEATNAVNLKLGGTYNLSEYGRDGLKKMKADLGQKRHDELQKL